MRRLQTLKQLTLDFISAAQISWQDFIHLLQLLPPSVQKLSLERLDLLNHKPPTHVLAEELVAQLVKFEEVDFGRFGWSFLRGWDVSTAILSRLTAVISSGEDSKLKVLLLPICLTTLAIPDETLAEARKELTVKIGNPCQRSVDPLIIDSDEDYEDDGDDDNWDDNWDDNGDDNWDDNWDEQFNESVKRIHNIVNCENCDGVFTPDHQC